MKKKLLLLPVAFGFMSVQAEVFYWTGDGQGKYTWGSFGDYNNWGIAKSSGEAGAVYLIPGENPEQVCPAAADEIYIGTHGESPYNTRWY